MAAEECAATRRAKSNHSQDAHSQARTRLENRREVAGPTGPRSCWEFHHHVPTNEAQRHLCKALRIATGIGSLPVVLRSLPATALLLADRGEAERAVEICALASGHPFVGNSRFWEDVVGRHVAAAAESLPPGVVAAAQDRGRARDLWATVEELLTELEGHSRTSSIGAHRVPS
jgi:hypothetical protein